MSVRKVITILVRYSFMSNLWWMLAEGIYLYSSVGGNRLAFYCERLPLWAYVLIGWGMFRCYMSFVCQPLAPVTCSPKMCDYFAIKKVKKNSSKCYCILQFFVGKQKVSKEI